MKDEVFFTHTTHASLCQGTQLLPNPTPIYSVEQPSMVFSFFDMHLTMSKRISLHPLSTINPLFHHSLATFFLDTPFHDFFLNETGTYISAQEPWRALSFLRELTTSPLLSLSILHQCIKKYISSTHSNQPNLKWTLSAYAYLSSHIQSAHAFLY
jgi:hypothetical protein